MGDHSAIEWTEATWNPVVGCTHVSEGCDNCYAAQLVSTRLRGSPIYRGLAVDGKFTGEVRMLEERLEEPLHWRKPRMIFVNSMSDLFHDGVTVDFIEQLFVVMASTPWHTYQILTKRPGRMASVLNDVGTRNYIVNHSATLASDRLRMEWGSPFPAWPLKNVWLGTSVENQKWADVRIPKLLEVPAAVRFLSCEPLLDRVQIEKYLHDSTCFMLEDPHASQVQCTCSAPREVSIDWVIVGGESGPNHRPMDPRWPREIRDDCRDAGVAFFFKQWGGRTPKAGGRELDGRLWSQMPRTAA